MDTDEEIVIIGIMRKTRKRIKTNAATEDKTMSDYVESIVPGGKNER